MSDYTYYIESTIPAIFRNRAHYLKDNVFLQYYKDGSWKDLSWGFVLSQVNAIAAYLIGEGINPGDNIAIYSENRPEWVYADLACLSAGAADVTIYPTNSAPEAEHILNNSDSRMCFCSGAFQVKNLLSIKDRLPKLEKIIVFNAEAASGDPMVVSLEDAIKKGAQSGREDEIDRRIRAIDPEDTMTLMYTSGTTGNPKGVMLSARNIVAQVLHMIRHQPHPLYESALSVLPLSHALERSIGYYMMMYAGGTIAYCRGTEHMVADFAAVRPTCFISVPRIPEKIYEGIISKVATAPFIKRAMFNWAKSVAMQASPFLKENRPLEGGLKRKYALADKLVLSKLRAAIGMDRMRCFGSGGAPLSSEIHDFFCGMGIFILPGYGLTECSPITHCHTHRDVRPIKTGSVGPAHPMTETRIADDGEILVRGPQIMKGYYKDEKATREVFTDDGFFMTGDIGHVDEDGYLYITDRKKDLIITAGGKNVAPQVIEGMILLNQFIDQVSLIGDRRKFVTALIVPNFDALKKWAQQNGVEAKDNAALVANEKIIKHFDSIIAEMNKELGRVEQVKKFTLLSEPFTQEKGEITPTLKIKRKVVQKNYSDLIEMMYRE